MNIFHITQKLDIIEENLDTQERFIYFSRIEDISEKSLFITPPFRKGYYLPPKTGRIITAKVAGEGCAYLFKTSLMRYSTNPILLWEISLPTNAKKVQLREYVRLAIALSLKIELEDEPHTGQIINTITKDISAGGLQVILPEQLPVDSKMQLTLSLDNKVTITAKAQIVRVIPPDTSEGKYIAAIKFKEIEEKTREQITKFVFSKQVERRQKEKSKLR